MCVKKGENELSFRISVGKNVRKLILCLLHRLWSFYRNCFAVLLACRFLFFAGKTVSHLNRTFGTRPFLLFS